MFYIVHTRFNAPVVKELKKQKKIKFNQDSNSKGPINDTCGTPLNLNLTLLISLLQLRTNELGQTIMALFMVGLHSGPWRSNVQSKVIHCRVFPRPISSAIMQP